MVDIDEKSDWYKIYLEIAGFRDSNYAKWIRENEPFSSILKEIEDFVVRISNMHSWYKGLPLFPGTPYYIF